MAVFDKKEDRNDDGTTTTITTSGEPIIVAPRCDETGLWKMNLDLDYKILGRTSSDQFIAGVDVANAIFDLLCFYCACILVWLLRMVCL